MRSSVDLAIDDSMIDDVVWLPMNSDRLACRDLGVGYGDVVRVTSGGPVMTDGQFRFSTDPWWLVIGKAVAIFVCSCCWRFSRSGGSVEFVSRMQNRIGPNRVGPQGLLQSLMDGFKLALKEEVIPKAAHLGVYWIAPVISATAAFIAFAVIPFVPTVSVFGVETPLQLTDFPVSVLYVLAIASIGVYGLVLAGWSSGSTYPLGGLRSTAQIISYEIAMGLSFVAVFIYAGIDVNLGDRGRPGTHLVRCHLAPEFPDLCDVHGR